MKITIIFGAVLLSLQVAVMHCQGLTADDLTCIQENAFRSRHHIVEVCPQEVLNDAIRQDVSNNNY